MKSIPYLTRRRETWFFRRRLPGFSTEYRPVLVSLGTTDRKLALKSCAKLTARMDLMLDQTLHITLPEADVTAFFQAELREYLRGLKVMRTIQHIDGTMTLQKARKHRIEAMVLESLAEDGLRQDILETRLEGLAPTERNEAENLHRATYARFMSAEFNEEIAQRAAVRLGARSLTEHDRLLLRKAVLDAQMAAHSALETEPIHSCDAARAAAVELLKAFSAPSSPADAPVADAPKSPQTTETLPRITDGVDIITGRITANSIYRQRDQALAQPEDDKFDGLAENVVMNRFRGADILGTAVRMIRKSRSQGDTCQQKLKSVSLFIYLTGVQVATDIRQHHLDMFAAGLEKQIPKHYWKSDRQKDMTFRELVEVSRNLPEASIGLASPTIARHLTTIASVIRFADGEGNKVPFTPATGNLVPPDKRSDAEKRAVFTHDHLKKVFQHPLWQGCKSKGRRHTDGDLIIKDHHYWINLLLAYTGARRSEIAGALETDIGWKDDIPFIYIKGNHLRGLKNRFSRRRIPLHPHLLELGFLDFVGKKRQRGQLVLFPEAIPAKVRDRMLQPDGPVPPYDKKFGDNLDHVWRQCLTRSLEGNPEKYCLASLRSYVNDTFINLRKDDGNTLVVPGIDRRDILGHRPQDVNEANYRRDEKPLGPLYVAVRLLPRLF